MPWNGYTEPEGTERIVCDTDLDGGGGNGGDPEVGSFLGTPQFGADPLVPTYAIGTSDMSVEFLVLTRVGDIAELLPDAGPNSGIANDGSVIGPDFGTTIGVSPKQGNISSLFAQWREQASGIEIEIASFYPRVAWTHLCINYDRSGDMEFFDNGVSAGTVSIAADAAVSLSAEGIYPAAIVDSVESNAAAWFTPMAGFAVHSRLLTGPEIATNVAALNVGSYAETEARYKFGSFVDASGDPLVPTKETTLANMGPALTWELPAAYEATAYAPEGADGTVFIEDLSGNGRHSPVFTDTSYGSSEGTRSGCAFSTLGVSP